MKRTYADIKLCRTPEHQRRIVPILRDLLDLHHTHHGADGRKKAEDEQEYETQLSSSIDLESGKKWDGQQESDDVAEDSDGSRRIPGRIVGQAPSGQFRLP